MSLRLCERVCTRFAPAVAHSGVLDIFVNRRFLQDGEAGDWNEVSSIATEEFDEYGEVGGGKIMVYEGVWDLG
jgi:hypothetical protein